MATLPPLITGDPQTGMTGGAVADASHPLGAAGNGLDRLQSGGQFVGQNPASESLYLLATASES